MRESGAIQQTCHEKACQPAYVIFAALVASIGGIMFGYDIGIISGALLQLKDVFFMSSFEQELVVSSVLIGAFCASFCGGNIVDSWGRKAGIILSCVIFIVGSLLLYFSINYTMLIIGRFIVGVAISISVTAECTYISEISPPSHRGMMVSFNEVGITSGFLLAYLVNYLFISSPNGWRYMFGVAAIPAIVQVIGIALMPNSHHHLLIKGKNEKARKVLVALRNNNDVDEEIESIITSINEQKNRRYVDLFSTTSNMRGRMILGMSLVFLQQFSGNANVLYYAPTVFQHFGYSSQVAATLVSVGLGVVKVLATIITLLIVDKVGRRSLLLAGCILMATSIIILGIVGTVYNSQSSVSVPSTNLLKTANNSKDLKVTSTDLPMITKNNGTDFEASNADNKTYSYALNLSADRYINEPLEATKSNIYHKPFEFMENRTNLSIDLHKVGVPPTTKPKLIPQIVTEKLVSLNNDNRTTLIESNDGTVQNITNSTKESGSFTMKIISVTSLMIFVCAYSISYGPVTWLVLTEIFPGSLRGRAVSVATCMNWGANILVSLTFLDILNAVGIGPAFVTYGFISYGAAIFVFFCVPETKNKTLEEIDYMLSKGLLRKDWKSDFVCYHRKYSIKNESFHMEMKCNSHQEKKDYKELNENS